LLIAQALATRGAVQLFSSDHAGAGVDLGAARARFSELGTVDDPEELARLDHNLGVVALYRGELERAQECFRAALHAKQALGDSAGMRACLRNLGYAALRADQYDEAARWLDQAVALARSLRQAAGEAWSLVTLAEVEVRRGRPQQAERQLAEIDAIGSEVPLAVRADVALVRAELALGSHDERAFEAALAGLDAETCLADAQVDTSRLLLRARASQARARDPVALRAALRWAVGALRRARGAQLTLAVHDAERAVRSAWQSRREQRAHRVVRTEVGISAAERSLIAALGVLPGAQVWSAFARYALHALGAERVFVLRFEHDQLCDVQGLDMDGLGIEDVRLRVNEAAAREALSAAQVDGGVRGWSRGPARVACVARTDACGSGGADVQHVALAEHRFLPNAFAQVAAQQLDQLRAMFTLTVRIAAQDARAAQQTRVGAPPMAAHQVPGIQPSTAAEELAPSEPRPTSSTALPTREPRHAFPDIVGSSRALRAALARLDAALDSELPLLLTGETGVGKELFARAVAELGPRRGRPFVALNCAAVAGGLFEAEFFGHERGAFTGADRRRSGVFVQADLGVLLLDEIGELPLAQQVALLRALETQRVRPLGAETERKFDVRLIAATNRDLERAVSEGAFRRDLLYRINVLEVRVPALRERVDDIEELALHFLRVHGSQLQIAPQALAALRAYAWPGNVRELAHTMQRLSALHETRIELAHLPRSVRSKAVASRAPERAVSDPRAEVLQTLERTSGNISHAARVLGLTRHGLKKRMLRLGLRSPSRGETS